MDVELSRYLLPKFCTYRISVLHISWLFANLSFSGFVTLLGHGIFKHYFRPITSKKNTAEDKDPPEGKQLPNPSGPYLLKVIPSPSSLWGNCQL